MTKNELAHQWLDRVYWRLLDDAALAPRGAHLNTVCWHERQFIAGIRRSIQRRVSTADPNAITTSTDASEESTE